MSDKIGRLRHFYDKKCPLSIVISLPMPQELKERLSQMARKLPRDKFPAAERLFPIWEELLTHRVLTDLDDDMPRERGMIYPKQYDQGIYGAMFGAEMRFLLSPDDGFGWASSNTTPFEGKSYDELLALSFDTQSEWLLRMREDLAYFAEKSRGEFSVSTVITIDGFNWGHQIAGVRILEDIHDCPEKIKSLMDFAADINIKFLEFQRSVTGETCESGTLILNGWFPGKTPSMSVDTFNMCSPDVYAEFGRPYHQRLIDHFGGGAFHLHGDGRHLLPEMAKLSGTVYTSVGNDGAKTSSFADRENIRKLAGDILIGVPCGAEELAKAIREKSLVPARYLACCDNRDEADRLLDLFKNYK